MVGVTCAVPQHFSLLSLLTTSIAQQIKQFGSLSSATLKQLKILQENLLGKNRVNYICHCKPCRVPWCLREVKELVISDERKHAIHVWNCLLRVKHEGLIRVHPGSLKDDW